jgi:hypothetical protein
VVRPVFRLIAASGAHELLTAAALFIILGITLLMEYLGLSMALGAFVTVYCWRTRPTGTNWKPVSSRSRACCWGCSSWLWA